MEKIKGQGPFASERTCLSRSLGINLSRYNKYFCINVSKI